MAAELIAAGRERRRRVNRRLYEEMPPAKLALLGVALERIQRFEEGTLTLVALDAVDFERVGAEESLSEGIVDHLRSVAATKVAVLIRELTRPRAGASARFRCAPRAMTSTCRRSPAHRAAGGTVARPASRRRSTVAELIELLRHEMAAQLNPAPQRAAGSHARLSTDGILLIDKPVGMTSHDVVAARSTLARRGKDRPRGDTRPICERVARSCSLARPRRCSARSWNSPSATRPWPVWGRLQHWRSRRRDHRDRADCHPTRPSFRRRDSPTPTDLLGDQDQRRARLSQGASWRELPDARANRDREPLRADLA